MNMIAGLAMGLTVGLLLGLSASPVASSVMASLLAVAVTFFGFEGKLGKMQAAVSSARVMTFCIGLLLATPAAIWLRTNHMLSPGIATMTADWRKAGYSEEQARAFVAYERLGLLIDGQIKREDRPVATTADSVLFSAATKVECSSLDRERFGSADARLKAMQDFGGQWAALVEAARRQKARPSDNLADQLWAQRCATGQTQ
jgi:hypothetical protein